jgi:hypothetical protein
MVLAGLVHSADQAPENVRWPLWDGKESIQCYAERAGLPPSVELRLADGNKIEFVLIPAGRFTMGQEHASPPSITTLRGKAIIAGSGGFLAGLLLQLLGTWIFRGQRPRYSLAAYSLFIGVLCVLVYGITNWHAAGQEWARYERESALDDTIRKELTDTVKAHPVLLTKPFYMAKTEVTQECYLTIAGPLPGKAWPGDHRPAVLPWESADYFCRRLDQGLQTIIKQLPIGQAMGITGTRGFRRRRSGSLRAAPVLEHVTGMAMISHV